MACSTLINKINVPCEEMRCHCDALTRKYPNIKTKDMHPLLRSFYVAQEKHAYIFIIGLIKILLN